MKPHLRKEMKAMLGAMPPKVAAAKSWSACKTLLGTDECRRASVIMLYAPMRGEVDCVEIALDAWRHEKVVLLPKVSRKQRHMMALECRSLDDEHLTVGTVGAREPVDGEPWPIGEIDLIVVPALAFDRRGHRLGRGGGFYDRFLSQSGIRAVACGLAFAEQVVEELPVHSNDHPVDLLVTDKEIARFANHSSVTGGEESPSGSRP